MKSYKTILIIAAGLLVISLTTAQATGFRAPLQGVHLESFNCCGNEQPEVTFDSGISMNASTGVNEWHEMHVRSVPDSCTLATANCGVFLYKKVPVEQGQVCTIEYEVVTTVPIKLEFSELGEHNAFLDHWFIDMVENSPNMWDKTSREHQIQSKDAEFLRATVTATTVMSEDDYTYAKIRIHSCR